MTRRLRLGMVGGGQGAFIGAVHRIAARLDDRWELVAGALASDPGRARASAAGLHIAPDRGYDDFRAMAAGEAARADGIDAVAIVTPNHIHAPAAAAFLDAGIHVVCDKPMTATLEQARDLVARVGAAGRIFAVTYTYTGYPLVREARALVAAGAIGAVRVVQVEYPQEWLTMALEGTGQKQAAWRTDPAQSGAGGSLGDIATHAFNLVEFVCGLDCVEVLADLSHFVPGRRLDDNAHVLLRLAGGARGMLWSSQVAPGCENALRIRVFGEAGGLSWAQEHPNVLHLARFGEPPRALTRAGPGLGPAAAAATRIPAGHPEGYLEAFAQLYSDVAEQITARLDGRPADATSLLVPGLREGWRGMAFVAACVESAQEGGTWCQVAAMGS